MRRFSRSITWAVTSMLGSCSTTCCLGSTRVAPISVAISPVMVRIAFISSPVATSVDFSRARTAVWVRRWKATTCCSSALTFWS